MAETNNSGMFAKIVKIRQFRHGDNFSQFIHRFQQYIEINKIQDENLHLIFLSMLDDRTYAKLQDIEITQADKTSADKFCKIYLKNYFPTSNELTLISELLIMKQNPTESIDDFSYRLDQNSQRINNDDVQNYKYTAFINGIKNNGLKIELKKACEQDKITNYTEAVNLAKNLDKFRTNDVFKSNSRC